MSAPAGMPTSSVYPGPIGAILTPQLAGFGNADSLPWASSLCGACYEVCPVKIDIPAVLLHLRGRVNREVDGYGGGSEGAAMGLLARVFASPWRYERAQRLGRALSRPLTRDGWISPPPPGTLGRWRYGPRHARACRDHFPRVVARERG